MTPMKSKRAKLTDQLREIVAHCGETRYAIAKATGISESRLSKLMNGQAGLTLKSLDVLGEYLGLRLTIDTRKRKGR
jgi:transcriptional regulator with XRE-family HTH domain